MTDVDVLSLLGCVVLDVPEEAVTLRLAWTGDEWEATGDWTPWTTYGRTPHEALRFLIIAEKPLTSD